MLKSDNLIEILIKNKNKLNIDLETLWILRNTSKSK